MHHWGRMQNYRRGYLLRPPSWKFLRHVRIWYGLVWLICVILVSGSTLAGLRDLGLQGIQSPPNDHFSTACDFRIEPRHGYYNIKVCLLPSIAVTYLLDDLVEASYLHLPKLSHDHFHQAFLLQFFFLLGHDVELDLFLECWLDAYDKVPLQEKGDAD